VVLQYAFTQRIQFFACIAQVFAQCGRGGREGNGSKQRDFE
jgi:hypothetical protein